MTEPQQGLIVSNANQDTHKLKFNATSGGNYDGAVTVQTVSVTQASEDRPLSYLGKKVTFAETTT